VVGCGGVGSYLIPALLRTVRNHQSPSESPEVVLVDGDILEQKNMDRQLFDEKYIGVPKSEAMHHVYSKYYGPQLTQVPEFFHGTETWVRPYSLMIACVDNHPGRMRVFGMADLNTCDVIMTGNGYTDAEAQFYSPLWRHGKRDPRIMFPEIVRDQTDDPISREAGCTGQAQEATPQLAIANMMAAAYALHLMWYHYQEEYKMDEDALPFSPIRHASNFSLISSVRTKEIEA
jgi:molybdopterin/thiamine biosynthesis adenylyltransferase